MATTIEQLAERLGGNLWIKEDKKRIYLDRGYNTKKMSTKTYVYQREDGTFGVSCFIECPSQSYQWIKSQQEEVIENVMADIEEALAETYYIIVDNSGNYIDSNGNVSALNSIYSGDIFFLEKLAESFISKELGKGYSVKSFDRIDFEKQVAELDEQDNILRAAIAAEEKKNVVPVIEKPKPVIETNFVKDYVIGFSYSHPTFGIGVLLSEDLNTIVLKFEVGEKQLLKKFAKLQQA